MSTYIFRNYYGLNIHDQSTKYIGEFNFEIEIKDIPLDITTELVDFCSSTFSNNFVIIEVKDRIVAGGWGDNYSAWKDGQFKVTKRWTKADISYSIFIRLYSDDMKLFNLRYSDEIKKQNK